MEKLGASNAEDTGSSPVTSAITLNGLEKSSG